MSGGKVAKNTAYLVSAFIGQKLLAFVYFMVVARSIGVQGTGRYFVALSFTTIFSIFVDLGLSNVLVRETAKFPEKAKDLLSTALGIKLLLAVATVIVANAIAWLLRYPPETLVMIALASVVMVLDATHLAFYATMRGFQNLRYEAIGVISGQFIIIASGLTFIKLHLPLPWLIVALLLNSTWNVIWSWSALARHFGVRPNLRINRTLATFLCGVTVPFALAGIFSRVYSYIDSVMLSKLATDTAVGLYGAAYKMTFAFQFLPMSFAAAIYPAMSEYYVKDRSKLSAIFAKALKYLAIVVLPLSFGIAVLAQPLVNLIYGPAFAAAALPLRIIIFSLIFAFLYWPAGSLLNACDRQSANTLVMGTTMGVNILLNLILIPYLQSTGAAIAALIGNLILFVGAVVFAHRVVIIDFHNFISPVLRTLAAATIMALVILPLHDSPAVWLSVPLGIVTYAIALFALKGVSVPEVKTLVSLLLRRGKGVSDLVP